MPNPRRRLALSALTAVFILAGATAAGWWWLDGRWHTSTDDAYVQGNLVQLTPQIAGIVIRINADDTALVREGDPVVVLDDADTGPRSTRRRPVSPRPCAVSASSTRIPTRCAPAWSCGAPSGAAPAKTCSAARDCRTPGRSPTRT